MDSGGSDISWLIGLDDLKLMGVLSRLETVHLVAVLTAVAPADLDRVVSCFADRGGALLRDEVEQSRGMDARPAQQALARLRQELP